MRSLMQTFLAGVAGALTVTVLMGATGALTLRDDGIVFPDGTVQTTAAAADPRRVFYLTASQTHDGSEALYACASGFHMASVWEILDVSNLRYATDEEGGMDVQRREDSGLGPPANTFGWVRTGMGLHFDNAPGRGNCGAWSSSGAEAQSGTAIGLEHLWLDPLPGPPVVVTPWDSRTWACSSETSVWCVAD